ncbi:uncharacterized protein [Rutidosis leptorrhynchoides]|uniref:uncharacterized protein n=1 Tax=Rutidosis leptorrhynchoides TaxID=125765 RepID=UPI003A99F450
MGNPSLGLGYKLRDILGLTRDLRLRYCSKWTSSLKSARIGWFSAPPLSPSLEGTDTSKAAVGRPPTTRPPICLPMTIQFTGILSYSQEPIPSYFKYFHQRRDATGLLGFTIYQKITFAIRQLAYGVVPDIFDEYLYLGATTSYHCLENYCKSVIHLFSTEYLIKPNTHDVQRLITKYEQIHGFLGMLGSLDCMHWAWKNCPASWKGQYTRGDHDHSTIMLEAVASYKLWIWQAYFGPTGSNNDINVLNQSDLFKELLEDRAPPCNYTVNGKHFTKGYYLKDGINPDWATFVKSFKSTVEPKTSKFKRYQESARKDIERAFGILQGRFAIIKSPARQFYIEKIQCIMYTCVISHNMITEDNGRAFCGLEEDYQPDLRELITKTKRKKEDEDEDEDEDDE